MEDDEYWDRDFDDDSDDEYDAIRDWALMTGQTYREVDQQRRPRQAEVHRRHEALPPREQARVAPAFGQQSEGLRDGIRRGVLELRRLHPPIPTVLASYW